jgi:hypothetical protein
MHAEVSALYEKLSVLKFAHENFEGDFPTIGSNSSFFDMLDSAFNNKVSDNIEIEDKIYIDLDQSDRIEITTPAMAKIKDMLKHMPESPPTVKTIYDDTIPKKSVKKHNLEDITEGFEDMPVFEPVSTGENNDPDKKKSLNDKLKVGGLKIGLNDKIAFIKHLFDGNLQDYDRVLSQLNTTESYADANDFIQNIVKPDYNNWEGKEEFEERFMEIIEAKFS